eukprot:s7083_g3.t1
MDVGAVERLLRSLALEGLGGLEFRVPAEVSRWFFAATRFHPPHESDLYPGFEQLFRAISDFRRHHEVGQSEVVAYVDMEGELLGFGGIATLAQVLFVAHGPDGRWMMGSCLLIDLGSTQCARCFRTLMEDGSLRKRGRGLQQDLQAMYQMGIVPSNFEDT